MTSHHHSTHGRVVLAVALVGALLAAACSGDDGVSEDEKKVAEKDIQKQHDDFIARLDEVMKGKEAEIMEV